MNPLSYKQRIALGFILLFALFTAGVIALELTRERREKTRALERELDAYARVAEAALQQGDDPRGALEGLMPLLPGELRLTWIDRQGEVLYDNVIGRLENHAGRPEIAAAREEGRGSAIRTSASNQHAYLYYARRFGDHYLRVALPYDVRVKGLLRPDPIFLWYVLALFAATLGMILLVAGRFGKSVRRLRDFTRTAQQDPAELPPVDFPADELGEIGAAIAENYRRLKENERAISLEREKLLQHVFASEEGICFFDAGRKALFYNGLFIQHLNTLADEAGGDPGVLFRSEAFAPVAAYLDDPARKESYFETTIAAQGRTFAVRVNVFADGGFEIIMGDISRREKTRLLKQEMTANIAHELRTPVTSIRGYLETLLGHPLDGEKQRQFLSRAYDQTLVLSELIRDIALIAKIEEAPGMFPLEAVAIAPLLEGLRGDLETPLREAGMTMTWSFGGEVVVRGNKNLLYAIFRNLTDNAIRYAGPGAAIRIRLYNEDSEFYYFSYADSGVGIPGEEHLQRLFERFYRVGEGRTRDTGGSGLGLSIVRNAVLFHKGTILAKNAPGGGLEFLFQLPKVSLTNSNKLTK